MRDRDYTNQISRLRCSTNLAERMEAKYTGQWSLSYEFRISTTVGQIPNILSRSSRPVICSHGGTTEITRKQGNDVTCTVKIRMIGRKLKLRSPVSPDALVNKLRLIALWVLGRSVLLHYEAWQHVTLFPFSLSIRWSISNLASLSPDNLDRTRIQGSKQGLHRKRTVSEI